MDGEINFNDNTAVIEDHGIENLINLIEGQTIEIRDGTPDLLSVLQQLMTLNWCQNSVSSEPSSSYGSVSGKFANAVANTSQSGLGNSINADAEPTGGSGRALSSTCDSANSEPATSTAAKAAATAADDVVLVGGSIPPYTEIPTPHGWTYVQVEPSRPPPTESVTILNQEIVPNLSDSVADDCVSHPTQQELHGPQYFMAGGQSSADSLNLGIIPTSVANPDVNSIAGPSDKTRAPKRKAATVSTKKQSEESASTAKFAYPEGGNKQFKTDVLHGPQDSVADAQSAELSSTGQIPTCVADFDVNSIEDCSAGPYADRRKQNRKASAAYRKREQSKADASLSRLTHEEQENRTLTERMQQLEEENNNLIEQLIECILQDMRWIEPEDAVLLTMEIEKCMTPEEIEKMVHDINVHLPT